MTSFTEGCEAIEDTRKRCGNTFTKEQNPSQDICKVNKDGFCSIDECPMFNVSKYK